MPFKTQTSSVRAKKLAAIAREIASCPACKMNKIGVAVPGEGSARAAVVFVGEAPGKEEAKTGRPFIGRSGRLLRALIAEVGLQEEEVFITSPVKYLPTYVTPTLEDIDHGRIHLFKQLAVIKPKIVVLLGSVAAVAVLREKISVSQEHGRVIRREGLIYFLTYHPAAALYNPRLRPELAEDFRRLKRLITTSG